MKSLNDKCGKLMDDKDKVEFINKWLEEVMDDIRKRKKSLRGDWLFEFWYSIKDKEEEEYRFIYYSLLEAYILAERKVLEEMKVNKDVPNEKIKI